MIRKLSVKIAGILIIVMIIIMSAFTVYFVRWRSENMHSEMLAKGRILAISGAASMERILTDAIADNKFSMDEIFDTNYKEIPGSAPSKYSTKYDSYLDSVIPQIEDSFLKDEQVAYAALVDRNAYLPSHNSKFSLPQTGDLEKDKALSRSKRIYNDPVGIAAAKNTLDFIKQDYRRDTGEQMWDISAPVYVKGKHWGAFRVGFSMSTTEAKIAQLRSHIIFAMLLMLIISSLTIIAVVTLLIRPLHILTEAAKSIAQGQLGEDIPIVSNDEIGTVSAAFNRMTSTIVKNLKSEIEKSKRHFATMKDAVFLLAGSSARLTAVSVQQSSSAAQQAISVQELTATAEQVAITARQIMDNAGLVEIFAEEANHTCQSGSEDVGAAIAGMEDLKAQVKQIAESMLRLGEDSQRIGGIIEIIDEISDQTNLLALNAAIESAGAGENGKRFAVVAKEVRRLAERTVDATRQIRELINEIRRATNSTIMLTEDGAKGVDEAGRLVDKVDCSFALLMKVVDETAQAARAITLSTKQQTFACQQIASTMNEVRDVAQQVADSTLETERAVTDINDISEQLRYLIEEEIQAKGRKSASEGAATISGILAEALRNGHLTRSQLFDTNYIPIPDTSPQKYGTAYDSYIDLNIQQTLDRFLLEDDQVVFAVLVDKNGYLPTHNTRYSKPLTGDPEKDKMDNRTKRIFNDQVGLAAAQNIEDVLVQAYARDTGEKMWDISAPVYLDGEHWGAFRVGYSM
jgi:methyl-accepting chemotaxis protein